MSRISESMSAFRALSALFLQSLLKPVMVIALVLLGAGYALMMFLVLSFSNWWLLLLILLLPVTVLVLVATLIARYILRKLLPPNLSKPDKQKITTFVEKVVGLAEQARLPYPVMLFLVAKDVIRGKESKFLRTLIGDSKGLMKEFAEIQQIFKS